MTYSLCFSRPRFFSRQNDRLTSDSWENPNFFGGHSFYYPKKICANELWSALWSCYDICCEIFASNFPKKKSRCFLNCPPKVKMRHIHNSVRHSRSSDHGKYSMSHPFWFASKRADSLLLTATNPGSDHAKASVDNPHFTMNHLTTTKTSVVYQPGRQGNYHKLYMPYIYIYFVCI